MGTDSAIAYLEQQAITASANGNLNRHAQLIVAAHNLGANLPEQRNIAITYLEAQASEAEKAGNFNRHAQLLEAIAQLNETSGDKAISDRYLGTLGLAADAPTSVMPHYTDFPAVASEHEWLESVSNTILPSKRKIQVTEQYMCVRNTTTVDPTAWERRSPQIIKQSWLSRFVKPGQTIDAGRYHLLEFDPNVEFGGHPIYWDKHAVDFTAWLPTATEPYKTTFNVSLRVNWTQQPSGQIETYSFSKLYYPEYDPGTKLKGWQLWQQQSCIAGQLHRTDG